MCAVAYARLRCTLRPLTIPYPAPLSPHRAHNTQRSQSSQHFLSFSLYASRSLEPAPWCSGPNQSTLYSLSRLNAPAGRRAPVISTLPRSRLPRLGLGARGGRTACCFVSHVHAGQPDECFLWHILHPTLRWMWCSQLGSAGRVARRRSHPLLLPSAPAPLRRCCSLYVCACFICRELDSRSARGRASVTTRHWLPGRADCRTQDNTLDSLCISLGYVCITCKERRGRVCVLLARCCALARVIADATTLHTARSPESYGSPDASFMTKSHCYAFVT